jgi:predicted nucleic acid-binding protein
MNEHEFVSTVYTGAFVDTNVFVYSQDASAQQKRIIALELIERLASEGRLVISTQVLQEFASAAVNKLGMSLPETTALIDELAKLPTYTVDTATIKNALTIQFAHRLSFFNSLIIATAARNGCSYLYSEDLADGKTIRGVAIINPFA